MPVENSTADESDDELLLTPKTHHMYKHSVCALPQTRTPDSDDELDLLSPNKTHHSFRSACTRDGCNDSSVDGRVLKGPRKLYRHVGGGKTRVTVYPTGFLDLPPEVILLCLWDLPFEDIERCLTLNRQIYTLVSGCAHMRYRAKQDRAGVEENHYAFQGQPWTIPERMAKLRDLEKRWLEFRPTTIHKLTIHNTGFLKVTADYFLTPHHINGESSKAIKYIKTSGGGCELESTFTVIDFTKPFVAFGTAIEEHDLIAAVYLLHDPTKESTEDTSSFNSLDVQFLRFSVGDVHPLASQPTLHIAHLAFDEVDEVHIEIVGKTMALSVVDRDTDGQIGWDTVYLYDWQCGSPIITAQSGCGHGFAFLTPQILLIPNRHHNALDVFRIPPMGTTPCKLAKLKIVSFSLPENLNRSSHYLVECFSQPNSREFGVSGYAPFYNVADKAIVRFLYVINEFSEELDIYSDESGIQGFDFFILREPFMRLINQSSKSKLRTIKWSHWGPWCSHMVKAINHEHGCAGTAAGQRIVISENNGSPTPIRIFDFNQYTVHAYHDHQATNSTNASIHVPGANTCSIAKPVGYIETVSHEKFKFDSIMINNQNIFGIKYVNDLKFELTVFHFG
ncbi:hypothetical protein GGX14DRAFT_572604 [Mycena pura]|uniref:F-box domain-containing protein n=1 Tax=Mycena pura TaxID=153505 RepID=A0AAD6V4S0_9AGAR|nr:hypothetical protein GGX14DRAFT_572604 [Mycena pura]